MFPAMGTALGLLHPVMGVVLQRGLEFQTFMNILNQFFLTIPGISESALVNVYVTHRQLTVNILA